MEHGREKVGLLRAIVEYVSKLPDSAPYWKRQAVAWGIVLALLVLGGVAGAVVTLGSVFGGGNVTYDGKGAPGPVTFSHYSHMWFRDGKYKACETCHDKLFATQKYGTYVLRALSNSPEKKFRIGRDSSTLMLPAAITLPEGTEPVTYEVGRACLTCATGNCHDGKESFSRLECLRCHQRR
ncbi:MAG: cytochrome c3 family protein [Thermodesulfobacteriota bacterium]